MELDYRSISYTSTNINHIYLLAVAFVVLEGEAEIVRPFLDVHVILDLEPHVQVGVHIKICKCRTYVNNSSIKSAAVGKYHCLC